MILKSVIYNFCKTTSSYPITFSAIKTQFNFIVISFENPAIATLFNAFLIDTLRINARSVETGGDQLLRLTAYLTLGCPLFPANDIENRRHKRLMQSGTSLAVSVTDSIVLYFRIVLVVQETRFV